MADLGSDISCVTDIDPMLTSVDGREALGQAIARRLGTPRGGLFYDANYGTDLRSFLNAHVTAERVAQAVEAEALKDERVRSASARITFVDAGSPGATAETLGSMEIELTLVDAAGPFVLTLLVGSVTVALLRSEIGG